jgi:hypothetical protein
VAQGVGPEFKPQYRQKKLNEMTGLQIFTPKMMESREIEGTNLEMIV